MENIIDVNLCCGCHACFNVCPTNAITMFSNDKGFLVPKIDQKKCINCKKCQKVCPILHTDKVEFNLISYCCINKNETQRLKSSSGGIFVLIAEKVIEMNGVVYGAAYDKNYSVHHIMVKDKKNLDLLMGSKYTQSEIGDIYLDVKKNLEKDIPVLFSGTPCQIVGLKNYLSKTYDNLYTVDFICHGVPSPLVWKKYLEYRENIDMKKPVSISFRDKTYGWNKFSLKFTYKDDVYINDLTQDEYLQSFLKNVSLRDSCFHCSFKGNERSSDITLADYWGVENIHFDMYDDKGTSLVILNSKYGVEMFSLIKDNINFCETNLDEAIKYNLSYLNSCSPDKKRLLFFKNLKDVPFNELVHKYTTKKTKFDSFKETMAYLLDKYSRFSK